MLSCGVVTDGDGEEILRGRVEVATSDKPSMPRLPSQIQWVGHEIFRDTLTHEWSDFVVRMLVRASVELSRVSGDEVVTITLAQGLCNSDNPELMVPEGLYVTFEGCFHEFA